MQIKAISLWQPWASLVAYGVKEYETRHWSAQYRGLLAIHAAKRWTLEEREAWRGFQRNYGMYTDQISDPLPLGAVVCVVRLVKVVSTNSLKNSLSLHELAFGNYAFGRYAWKLEMVKRFDEPIPAKGAQSLWEWELPDGITL